MKTSKLYQEIRENRHHILFERLFSVDKNNQVVPIPNVELRILNGLPFVYNTNPNEMLPLQNLNAFQETLPSVSHSPFTSKGYPLKKDWKSYNTYDLGRAFFSDGYVNKNHCFQVFDHINLLSQPWLKDESLYYKKKEIPISVYTTNSEEELKNKYSRLEIDYDEIAVFFIKKPEQKEINVSVNLGDSLLKLSNLKDEIVMQNKRWTVSELELKQLTENFSAQKVVAFLNKNNMLFAEEEAHISGLFPTKKTKVHLTIGMFFDGTGNNRFNSDKVYYPNLDKNNNFHFELPKNKKTIKVDGKEVQLDSNSSYLNAYSNVALLHDLYETKNEKTDSQTIKVVLKQYVQGIGTLKDQKDDIYGSGFGDGERGIIGKVREGCYELANKQLKNILKGNVEIGSITFDVFGFSRGAAAARHFCNEILGKESIEDIYKKNPEKNQTKNQPDFLPIGKKYLLGILGEELKKAGLQNSIIDNFNSLEDNSPINIRFLGLYDTVVSQFIPKYYKDFHLDKLAEYNEVTSILKADSEEAKVKISHLPIKKVIHLVAADEWRENFPLTSSNEGVTIPIIGAHSDIGGGYAATLQENSKLHFFTIKTGTGIDDLNNPKIDSKILALRDFYINKGYCNPKQIAFKKIGNTTIRYDNFTNANDGVIFRIEATRTLIPRYSTVSLYLMHQLGLKCSVPFYNSHTDIKPLPNQKYYPFEYEIPKELNSFYEIMIKMANEKYSKVYEEEKIVKETKVEEKLKQQIRRNFVHLSANFNHPEFVLKVSTKNNEVKFDSNEVDFINKLAYVNHPRLIDNNSYEREIFKKPNK